MRITTVRRTTASVLAAALCAAALAPAAATTAAVTDPAPAAVHAEQAVKVGSLSRAEVAAYLTGYGLGEATYAVDLYRIAYRTPGADGRATTASALVVVPRTTRRERTVLWLHGTRAYRGDTASVSDNYDRASAVQFATAGHPTVAPDYLGLGEGRGTHPYMVARPTVSASVDALHAARALTPLDRRVLVTGFSQGGQVAMLVGRALRADHHFRLAALAAISGPHDIRGAELPAALDGRLDGVSATFYLGYAMVSWNRRYHLWDDPAEVFRPPYAAMMDRLFDNDTQEADIVAALPATPRELFTRPFLELLSHPSGRLAQVLAREDTACRGWRPDVPVRLYTASGDRDVAIANTLHCRDQFAAHGTRATVVDLGDHDHFTTGRLAVPKVLAWFERVS
jgi:hypothetical protein